MFCLVSRTQAQWTPPPPASGSVQPPVFLPRAGGPSRSPLPGPFVAAGQPGLTCCYKPSARYRSSLVSPRVLFCSWTPSRASLASSCHGSVRLSGPGQFLRCSLIFADLDRRDILYDVLQLGSSAVFLMVRLGLGFGRGDRRGRVPLSSRPGSETCHR